MVAAAIIPRWRFNELEPELSAISPVVPLVLTLVLVVVALVDLAGNLLNTRWRRSHQVTFLLHNCGGNGFLHLLRTLGKLV